MAALRLEELTAKTIVAARNLSLKKGQEAFIAPETYVHAEDQIDPAASWPRVVLDEDDTVVGYIMGTFDPNASQDFLKAALWKVNVEAKAQGSGVGRFAVEALADEARRRGFQRLTVVWASGEGGPEEFFKAIGFTIVGQTPYGENLGALKL
jgi:diamine N-acetyltransferase